MKIYIVLITVATISFGVSFFVPTKELLQGIYATPGIIALLGVLYQIFRDESAHQKNIELQNKQHFFNIGAASHMANVAFDKHVEFCEKYMKEVHETVTTLFSRGPTDETLNHAGNFHILRQEYAAWLTEDINENLFPFEQALRSLGASDHFVKSTSGNERYGKQRQVHLDKSYDYFYKIMSLEEDEEPDPEIAVEIVKKKIREILGIEQLVQLRKHIIIEASNAIKKT